MQQTSSQTNRATVGTRLDELVALMSARVEAGESVDLAALTADCPELREQLEMLLPTLQAVVEFEQNFAHADATVALTANAHHPASNIQHPVAGILGDFRILRELGRGGMGVVYEAEQISIGRRVALKVLPFAAMLDKQPLNRFKNEARAAGTLDHPNIVAIYSVGCERGVHYYAMQCIDGQSLAETIAEMKSSRLPSDRNGSDPIHQAADGDTVRAALPTLRNRGSAASSTIPDFDSREYCYSIARLGIQAAEALDHAHQNGILHRDVKPANLLVDDTGKLWITDFGLARIEQDVGMTLTGDLLGTLRYMSPEQSLAKRVVVDHRSDIYSLGVTLYELLTLQPAFTGEDRQELLQQIAFEDPLKPRHINSRIPQDLETIVLKAIEKNPSDRYTSAIELANDLKCALNHQPIQARPPSWRDRTVKWVRRHRAAVNTAIASMVFLGLTTLCVLLVSNAAIKKERSEKDRALHATQQALSQLKDQYRRMIYLMGGFYGGKDRNEVEKDVELRKLRQNITDELTADIEADPTDPQRWFHRGTLHFQTKNYSDAVADLSHAIELNPDSWDLWELRTQTYDLMDDWQKVVDGYTEQIARFPGWRRIHSLYWRGQVYFRHQKYAEAVADLSRVIDKQPDYDEAMAIRAECYVALDEPAKAIADYEQAVQLPNTQWQTFSNFASLLATTDVHELRDGKRAVELATKGWDMGNHEYPFAAATLASSYSEIGDFESAVKWLERANELAPDNEDYKARLDLLRKQMASRDSALKPPVRPSDK